MARRERNGSVVARDGVFVALQLEERFAASAVGARLVRLERYRLLITRNGGRGFSQGEESIPPVDMGGEAARIVLQDFPEERNGTVQIARLGGDDAEQSERLRLPWAQPQNLETEGAGLIELPGPMPQMSSAQCRFNLS